MGQGRRGVSAARVRRVAREQFGLDEMRPGQAEAIRAVLDGHDTLAVMPSGAVEVEQVERVLEAVREHDGAVTATELRTEAELTESKLTAALGRPEEVDAVAVRPNGGGAETEAGAGDAATLAAAAEAQANLHAFARSRVETTRGYAEPEDAACRRHYLLAYFGEASEPPRGACDAGDAGGVGGAVKGRLATVAPFPLQGGVTHRAWGVMRYDGDTMTVLFDTVGYRTLGVDIVRDEGLLESIG